jgi:hypothetical protein
MQLPTVFPAYCSNRRTELRDSSSRDASATLLTNGKVLVAGGTYSFIDQTNNQVTQTLQSSELYDQSQAAGLLRATCRFPATTPRPRYSLGEAYWLRARITPLASRNRATSSTGSQRSDHCILNFLGRRKRQAQGRSRAWPSIGQTNYWSDSGNEWLGKREWQAAVGAHPAMASAASGTSIGPPSVHQFIPAPTH